MPLDRTNDSTILQTQLQQPLQHKQPLWCRMESWQLRKRTTLMQHAIHKWISALEEVFWWWCYKVTLRMWQAQGSYRCCSSHVLSRNDPGWDIAKGRPRQHLVVDHRNPCVESRSSPNEWRVSKAWSLRWWCQWGEAPKSRIGQSTRSFHSI
jgi:hypothetical protein